MKSMNGIATKGRPFLMRYNDPWTPPFLRRNEVAIEISTDKVQDGLEEEE
jgi:hypothetical protein